MNRIRCSLMAAALALSSWGAAGCASSPSRPDGSETAAPPDDARNREIYEARLAPLNVAVAGGPTSGSARLVVRGDEIDISVDVEGAPPGIVHIQHIHGFVDGQEATCATASSDANGDGIIDLLETEENSGTTLVPFHGDPATLAIDGEGYPTADATGAYHYRSSTSRSALEQALQQANGAELDPASRVVYVHGVYEDRDLPPSVASLPDVPAHVTLPIACGELRQISRPRVDE